MRNSNWLPAGSKNRPALPGKTDQASVPYVIAPAETYADDEGTVNLVDYGQILWRRKGTLVIVILAECWWPRLLDTCNRAFMSPSPRWKSRGSMKIF